MIRKYQIFTDATADLSPKLLIGLTSVEIISMQVEVDGTEYTYGTSDGITADEFYYLQKAGHFATTSQINPTVYFQHFEPYLRHGIDILYLCFSSGMSGTYQSAMLALQELQEKYPERTIICIDTLGAAIGEGLLVMEAAKRQAAGSSIDELAKWIEEHRLNVCHWFTIDTFTHLKHGGRVSAATAAMGTALNIKPLLHVDKNGKLQSLAKPRGRKKAVAALVEKMEQGWIPELSKTVFIAHSADLDGATMLKKRVSTQFPNADIRITDIGPIIGAHTGPGTLVLVYWGMNR